MKSPLNQIALLIDADNVASLKEAQLAKIITLLEELGAVTLRRAYGHWGKPQLAPLAKILHKFAILPVQQFDYISGKNATDIALTIDAMDLLHSDVYGGFAIVTCDSDFTPLVVRLRTGNAIVCGFGRANKTSIAFKEACSCFFEIGDPNQSQQASTIAPSPQSQALPTAAVQNQTQTTQPTMGQNSPSNQAAAPATTPQKAEQQTPPQAAKTTTTKASNVTSGNTKSGAATTSTETIETIFREAVETNLKDGWARVADVGAFLSKHKKLKKNYNTQTWAKYYQRFSNLFEVKKTNGTTCVRPKR